MAFSPSVCLSLPLKHTFDFSNYFMPSGVPLQNPGRGSLVKGAFFSQAQALRHFLTRVISLSLMEAENKQLWCPMLREPPRNNPSQAAIAATDQFTHEDLQRL